MVLNYRPANYIGWPIPACNKLYYYPTKVQLFLEFSNIFTENILLNNVIFMSQTPLFQKAFQHFFVGYGKSVGKPRSKFFNTRKEVFQIVERGFLWNL